MARLPCCRHRSEHIAGTVPSFPRHTAIPTLHLGKDVKNTAKLAVPAFTGTPVFGHQAIAYFIVRHQVLLLSHSSVNFHSQLKVGSSHLTYLKMGCDSFAHKHILCFFPLSCPLRILHTKILPKIGLCQISVQNLQRCAINYQMTTNLGAQYHHNVTLQPFLRNVTRS